MQCCCIIVNNDTLTVPRWWKNVVSTYTYLWLKPSVQRKSVWRSVVQSSCFPAFVFASPPQVMAGVGGCECSDDSVFISISTLVLFHHGASSHLPPNITWVFPEELRHRTTEPGFDHHKDPRVSQGDRSLFLSFFKSLVFPWETLVSKDEKGRGGEQWGRSGFSQVTNLTVLLVSSSQIA